MLSKVDVDNEKLADVEYEKPGILTELLRATKTGFGMFTEAYFIFAVGNNGTIWKDLYPVTCFKNGPCTQVYTAITYVQISGIITAQLTFGFFADHLGRRWGSRITSTLMFIGGLLLTLSYGIDITGQFAMFCAMIFILALGVGGEYPLAATSASERSTTENIPRGRTVGFTFAHQGWGNTANTMVICFLLAVTGTGGCTTAYSTNSTVIEATNLTYAETYCNAPMLEVTWRLGYGMGVIGVFVLVLYRWFILSESKMWVDRQDEKYNAMELQKLHEKRLQNSKLLFSAKYFPRLFGAGFTWFLNDVAFYGNKLFQGTIITAIIGKQSTLQQVLNYTLLNSVVGLVGYYFAAFTLDYKWMGRVRMQNMGFAIITTLFLACGFAYSTLITPAYIGVFQFMYLMSSFFQQFGPNVTTWLLPVELFPTDVRVQAHGYCAATGKAGALLATLLFSYGGPGGGAMPAQTIFIVSGFVSLAGLVITILFVPDITNVPLHEIERRWSMDRRAAQGEPTTTVTVGQN